MRRHRITRTAALGLVLAAVAAPAAFAQQDLRSPDARDAARAAMGLTQPAQDLRSPDTRDIGRVYHSSVSVPASTPTTDDGGLGVAIIGGVAMLVALGGIAIVAVGRQAPRRRVAAALADGTRDWRRGAGL